MPDHLAAPTELKPLEEAAQLLLLAGRLLLANGAESENVQNLVCGFGNILGYSDLRCVVTYDHLLLTLCDGVNFRTRIGRHVMGLAVNMAVVTQIERLFDECRRDPKVVKTLPLQLAELEASAAGWNPLTVVALVGLTTACVSRLLGGSWSDFAICWAAGACGMIVRLLLSRMHANAYLISFCAALVSGTIATLFQSGHADICLVSAAIVIFPGVPLVNALLDLVKNNVMLGVGRCAQGMLTIVAISLGLAGATLLTHISVPVNMSIVVPEPWEVAVFSSLGALGYAVLFNIPRHIWWGCMACGCVSFTTRAVLMRHGVDISLATLLGAFLVGLISQWTSGAWRVPPAAVAYPGVVAMLPGPFAFRAAYGLLQIAQEGQAPPPLIGETLSLLMITLLLVGAIAVGLALPVLGWEPRPKT